MYAVNQVDDSVWRFMIEHRSAHLTEVFSFLTVLCNPLTVIAITVVVGVALLATGFRPLTLRLSTAVAGAWLTATALKLIVARPRPPVAERLITVTEYSFPSGHATQSIALWSSLALVAIALASGGLSSDEAAPRFLRLVRPTATILAVVIAIGVGLSRLYLGVHWFTDVIGGWLVGASWCLLSWRVIDFRGIESTGRRHRADTAGPSSN